jgi:hypothetical protein
MSMPLIENRVLILRLSFRLLSKIASMVMGLPFAIYHDLVEDEPEVNDAVTVPQRIHCRETWPSRTIGKVAIAYVVSVTYVIPLTLIVCCYTGVLRHIYRHQTTLNARNPFANVVTAGNLPPLAAVPIDAAAVSVDCLRRLEHR